MSDNHYKTLQVDPKAEPIVVTAAYRALVKKYNDDGVRMRKLNAANEILSDDAKRLEYDSDDSGKVKRGKLIGEYRILESIAEGGFGVTYKAEHQATGKLVCIKHALRISPLDEQILLDEARCCWDLRHWGIPCVRDIIKMPDKSIALVMSYVPGPTLAEILQMPKYQSGLDPEHVAWISERLLNILKYLHSQSVVHGDVKPQNVIIQPENHTVVLVDYGLSKVKPTRNDTASGYTEYFAAPEQIEEKPPIPQTDFFGLGMTMIFALGGDVTTSSVGSHVPKNMLSFIKRLIKRSPLKRPDWDSEDLCATISDVRIKDFSRKASGMKPLEI